ncbi:MAG TPA: proton-conducting transporter membrane subunit [Chondromyces sp.]|nr:proton-conducting transporter membrane subunit [Chondromyces sp.]
MRGLVVVAPIAVPLLAAAGIMISFRSLRLQKAFGLAGAGALLAFAVALMVSVWRNGSAAVNLGAWPAPIAINLVADTLASLMVLLASLVGAAVALYALAEVESERSSMGFYAYLMVLLAGVNGAFLTADLFNLYVCFEVMLMASFVLLVLGGGREQMEGGLKYVALNLFASALFLAAVGIVYGAAGSLNLGELAVRMPEVSAQRPELTAALAGLFLVAFGIKAALFPLYFWLPASYHTPPAAVSAVFAGLLTKVGVYALIRVFPVLFAGETWIFAFLVLVAALTMMAGVVGAVAQFHIRRILSFHIISQIGYMVVGLGLVGIAAEPVRRAALAAAVFYIAHHILVKTNLFLVAGAIRRFGGSEDLGRLGGLSVSAPWLAVLFLIPAASLAGIPPLSGFWAKLAVIRVAIECEAWLAVVAALAAGLLTLLSMTKIWNEAFWKAAPTERPIAADRRGMTVMVVPIVLLAAVTVVIGLVPQPLFAVAERAAAELLDLEAYRAAVGIAGGLP